MSLLNLVAAMKDLEDPKLTKTDAMRLRTLIQTSNVYQKRFAENVGYRRIERKLVEMDEFFERLKKKLAKQKTSL
jgi:ABC-type transport system involved in Fe-S cluster assembly fused permease/ATPase subunit